MNKIKYRPIKKYKYQLMDDYRINIDWLQGYYHKTRFLTLRTNGDLKIKSGYCWDGPSGPTIDTKNFMRGSLVHDVLYQLIRMYLIPKEYRDKSDRTIQSICIQDGMSKIRAWWVYYGLKLFGGFSAKPKTQKKIKIIEAP